MVDDNTPSAVDSVQAERIAAAPGPTPSTLRHRQNVLFQVGRFIRLNLRMLRVISAKHS